ncbi:MAG: hypothetical protein ACKO6B_15010 [Planctomycetia bacterium]
MIIRCFCLRLVSLFVVVAAIAVSGEAVASPARRLARRGVVVVPVPVPVPVREQVREQVRVTAPQPAAAAEEIAAPLPAPAGAAAAAERSSPGDEQIAFTPTWYASHPQAWRPVRSSADWWRGADQATVTSWLGRPVSTAGAAAAGAGSVTTAGAGEVGADGLKSVLVLPAGHDNAAAAAGEDWLPLGVFAVVPQGEAAEGGANGQHHNYQQLAVDRQGAIRGNFYDAISDTLQPISGTVDRDTLTASWTVGTNGSRFTAPLRAFTAPPRTVSVTSGGASRQLQMLPFERPQ